MAGEIRTYEVQAHSTGTFGRVLCGARQHHFIVDGPVQNGCPGEAITPSEVFLSGVAACGVELIQVLAKQKNFPLSGVDCVISGSIDRSNPVRKDVSLFNKVNLKLRLSGVSQQEGNELVEAFKSR